VPLYLSAQEGGWPCVCSKSFGRLQLTKHARDARCEVHPRQHREVAARDHHDGDLEFFGKRKQSAITTKVTEVDNQISLVEVTATRASLTVEKTMHLVMVRQPHAEPDREKQQRTVVLTFELSVHLLRCCSA
jgi:hypothetical protein